VGKSKIKDRSFFMYQEFIGNEKFARKDADIADRHEAFKSCGWVLTEHELVVDIDNVPKEVIEKVIDIFNIKTQTVWTTRGVHFYFKKPRGFKGSKKVCPLGFEVEYKHLKNTPNGVKIKENGELRIIENEGVREELNPIFYTNKRLVSLFGLDESEGRNNALFAHRMKIHDIDNWQSILRFINNYIFASPLPENEFQTISRDVKIEAKTNAEPEVADYILKKYKVVTYQGNLYWFEDGHYIQDEARLKQLVFDEVGLKKTRYVDEVIRQLEYRAPIIKPDEEFVIQLQNGILCDGDFIEVKYQEFTPYNINIPYNEDAEPVAIVDEYINHLTNDDDDYRKRLLEILAHTLIVDKKFKRQLAKFFIFVGGGGNGKGTLLYIIRTILGSHNCSALSIKNMTDERYFTTMQGKLVNLGDDVEDRAIDHEQMKIIKNISTCDYVSTRNLFEQSKDIELTLSLIFTSNHILKSFEKGESYKRRVDWCPMFSKPKKKDRDFIDKLTTPEALKYWMKLIVEGYMRLYQNQDFTESEMVTKFNEEYHENNNTVLEYLNDYDKDFFLGARSKEIYDNYEIWAEDNGLNVQSKKLFNESIYDVFGLKSLPRKINGKSARVYQEVKEEEK
jgi:putative DNA primase/helicase